MNISRQSGGAHAIIILGVALLGALGFVFWQNFIDKPATSAEITQTDNDNSHGSEMSTLEFDNWGIKIA